jgi:RNA polymerase sigma-70 factor (ECF subfamily)
MNDTHHSLIMRLPSQSDVDAWSEFSLIYEPMLYRFGRRRGLQDADARELVQSVMISVARAVERWEPNREKARFRTWLFRIARNQWLNMATKRRLDVATGRTTDLFLLHAQVEESEEDCLLEYRREVFRLAAAHVRDSIQPATWEAFWRTSVLDIAADQVAKELGMSTGAVYIARYRVTQRLKSLIEKWEQNDEL